MAQATGTGRRIGRRATLPLGLLAALLLVVASLGLAHAGHVDAGPAPHTETASAADEAACLDHVGGGHVADACGGALCVSIFLAPCVPSPGATVAVSSEPHPGAHRPEPAPGPQDRPPIAG
jgi:hypothetical protein